MKKLLILLAFFALSFTAEAQKSAKEYHEKLQLFYSFESVMKRNEAFTLKAAKRALKVAKKKARKARRDARRKEKRDAIYTEIEKLKDQ